MPISRKQKEEIVQNLADEFKNSKAVVFSDYKGLTVNEMEELRGKLREADSKYFIAKKTLIKLAMDKSGIDADMPKLDGPVGVAFSNGDETTPARILYNFGKEHEALELTAGILESELIDQEKVTELAKLPTKEELLGKVVGTINAPVAGFARVLSGNIRGLVQALKGIADSK